ncbi:MAG: glucan biosynthesis protein, partial [Akkermansiaceae bacterium]
MISRRALIQSFAAMTGMVSLSFNLQAAEEKFDTAWLRAEAKRISGQPYVAPPAKLPSWIDGLDYDAYQSIKFRKDKALWQGKDRNLEVRLFHLGLFFRHPVSI